MYICSMVYGRTNDTTIKTSKRLQKIDKMETNLKSRADFLNFLNYFRKYSYCNHSRIHLLFLFLFLLLLFLLLLLLLLLPPLDELLSLRRARLSHFFADR